MTSTKVYRYIYNLSNNNGRNGAILRLVSFTRLLNAPEPFDYVRKKLQGSGKNYHHAERQTPRLQNYKIELFVQKQSIL